MSSMYNMLFGMYPEAPGLLALLNTTEDKVPRLRDAFVHGQHVVIYTRTGGANRDDYEMENEYLRSLPGYSHDQDDEFDSTFALFFYTIPEQLSKLIDITEFHRPLPEERWKTTLADLKKSSRGPSK